MTEPRRVTTRIRDYWHDQDGVRRAYCPVGPRIVTVAVPRDHDAGREVTIEQDLHGRWLLCRAVTA